jgi:hypothetical protein
MVTALVVVGVVVVLAALVVVYVRLAPKQYLSARDRELTQAQQDRATMTSMQARQAGGRGF